MPLLSHGSLASKCPPRKPLFNSSTLVRCFHGEISADSLIDLSAGVLFLHQTIMDDSMQYVLSLQNELERKGPRRDSFYLKRNSIVHILTGVRSIIKLAQQDIALAQVF